MREGLDGAVTDPAVQLLAHQDLSKQMLRRHEAKGFGVCSADPLTELRQPFRLLQVSETVKQLLYQIEFSHLWFDRLLVEAHHTTSVKENNEMGKRKHLAEVRLTWHDDVLVVVVGKVEHLVASPNSLLNVVPNEKAGFLVQDIGAQVEIPGEI